MALPDMLDITFTQWEALTKQQLTPKLNSIEISVRMQSDVSFCAFHHLKLLSTTAVSLPTADWQPEVHAVRAKGCSGQMCHTPQAFGKLQKCSCSQSWGTLAPLRQGWTPQSLQDAPEPAGTAGGTGIRELRMLGTVPLVMFSPCWGVS